MNPHINYKALKKIVIIRHGESTQNYGENNNIDYDMDNIKLTDFGKTQAKHTGKHLSKCYEQFDIIYSSPIDRCVETSNIISSNLGKNIRIINDELLIEQGENNYKPYNMFKTFEERKTYLEKYRKKKKVKKLEDKLSNLHINPFDKLIISKKLYGYSTKKLQIEPSYKQTYSNYNEFLDKIKKSDDINILVVAHGGTINNIIKIICGISIYNDQNIVRSNTNNKGSICPNCSITCIQLNPNNKYELVSAPYIYHLNDLNN